MDHDPLEDGVPVSHGSRDDAMSQRCLAARRCKQSIKKKVHMEAQENDVDIHCNPTSSSVDVSSPVFRRRCFFVCFSPPVR